MFVIIFFSLFSHWMLTLKYPQWALWKRIVCSIMLGLLISYSLLMSAMVYVDKVCSVPFMFN